MALIILIAMITFSSFPDLQLEAFLNKLKLYCLTLTQDNNAIKSLNYLAK